MRHLFFFSQIQKSIPRGMFNLPKMPKEDRRTYKKMMNHDTRAAFRYERLPEMMKSLVRELQTE